MKKGNNTFLIVLFALITILVFMFPKIYTFLEDKKLPKVEKIDDTEVTEKKEVDNEVLESIHYPIMRNSIYNENTYYKLDKFTMKNMSNQDILYSAFLDMYEGNIVDSSVRGECVTSPKEFNSQYIELRIKNIIGKNISYKLENFSVPEDSSSNYKGTWTYDSTHSRYIYNAYCGSISYNARYYNLEEFIKAEYEKNDIVVYYYVGFAKVENGQYVIYKDANMKEELTKGSFSSVEDLNNVFKSIKQKDKKIYKYTFKDTLCSYNDYCLYEGKWVNEL